MIGVKSQKIYRLLCETPGMMSQVEIAERCDCSLSYVNKVLNILKRKKCVHQPYKNRISVLNFQSLLLMWAFTRDIEDEEIKEVQTTFSPKELEEEIPKIFNEYALGLFSSARFRGIKEVPYDDIYIYLNYKEMGKLKRIEPGNKSRLYIIISKDEAMNALAEQIEVKNFTKLSQTFVDLVSLNTWESNYTALKLSEIDDRYPIFGSKKELEGMM
jgi:hypothetical protein